MRDFEHQDQLDLLEASPIVFFYSTRCKGDAILARQGAKIIQLLRQAVTFNDSLLKLAGYEQESAAK